MMSTAIAAGAIAYARSLETRILALETSINSRISSLESDKNSIWRLKLSLIYTKYSWRGHSSFEMMPLEPYTTEMDFLFYFWTNQLCISLIDNLDLVEIFCSPSQVYHDTFHKYSQYDFVFLCTTIFVNFCTTTKNVTAFIRIWTVESCIPFA